MEDPPKKFFRLSPGREVRLRYAYFITCEEVVKDAGRRTSSSSAAPTTRRRAAATRPDGRKVKATLHWVSAATPSTPRSGSTTRSSRSATRRSVAEGVDWKATLNPKSLEVVAGAKLEPALAAAAPESRWQFERLGYFVADRRDSKPGAPVFNRTVTLRDEWARLVRAGKDAA